jgi:hypothetical protein
VKSHSWSEEIPTLFYIYLKFNPLHLFHSIHGIVKIGKNVEESKVEYHSQTGAGTDQKYVLTDISLTEIRDVQNKNPEYGR